MEITVTDRQNNKYKLLQMRYNIEGNLIELILKNSKGEEIKPKNFEDYIFHYRVRE